MQVSHSGTPQLNILEILKHFWPASEPCRQATNRNMYFIFLIRAIPPVPYPSCKQEVMSMQNLATVLCKVWWEFRWNLVIYGSKCLLFWRESIKRADLQTAYRYRTESFRVDFHMTGRSTWVITRSDHMQVSHSGTPQLNILEILKHFWPASEPCRQATISNMYIIFLLRAIHPLTYPTCK